MTASSDSTASSAPIRTAFGAAAWGVGAFLAYYHLARLARIGWNAIEMLIAQHWWRDHVYAISVDYPSAIAWRPVFPTAVVMLAQRFTDDPQRILRGLVARTLP